MAGLYADMDDMSLISEFEKLAKNCGREEAEGPRFGRDSNDDRLFEARAELASRLAKLRRG